MTQYTNITLNGKKVADYINCEYDPISNVSYFQYSLTKSLTALSLKSFFDLVVKMNDEMLRNSKINHPLLKDQALKHIFDRLNDTDGYERNDFEATYFEMHKISDSYENLTLPKVEGIKTYHSDLEPWIGYNVETINFEKINSNNTGFAAIIYKEPSDDPMANATSINQEELNNYFVSFQDYCDSHQVS
jgi:hypothetical protein